MQIIKYPEKKTWNEILARPTLDNTFLQRTVANILNDVRQHGDAALKHCARHFDKVELDEFLVSEKNSGSEAQVSGELKDQSALSKANIESFTPRN